MRRRLYKMGILLSHECSLISARAEKIADSYLSNCEEYEKHRDQNFIELKTTRIPGAAVSSSDFGA